MHILFHRVSENIMFLLLSLSQKIAHNLCSHSTQYTMLPANTETWELATLRVTDLFRQNSYSIVITTYQWIYFVYVFVYAPVWSSIKWLSADVLFANTARLTLRVIVSSHTQNKSWICIQNGSRYVCVHRSLACVTELWQTECKEPCWVNEGWISVQRFCAVWREMAV